MKAKVEQRQIFQEYMNKQDYHRALFLLSEVGHPALLQLFPRLSNIDIQREVQTNIEVNHIDFQKLKEYIAGTRRKNWAIAIFHMGVVFIVIAMISGGLLLSKLENPVFLSLLCLGILLTPVTIIPAYISSMLIYSELKSKFYSVL